MFASFSFFIFLLLNMETATPNVIAVERQSTASFTKANKRSNSLLFLMEICLIKRSNALLLTLSGALPQERQSQSQTFLFTHTLNSQSMPTRIITSIWTKNKYLPFLYSPSFACICVLTH